MRQLSIRSQMPKRRLLYDAEAVPQYLARQDEVMRGIIRACGPLRIEARGSPYQSLLRAILYQQLAGAAAAAIERRLLGLFGGTVPRPEELLATKPEALRNAGISRQKASYFHSLAEYAKTGALEYRRLSRLSDEEVIERVTAVRGIGRWTAEMLLMFCLGRPDVLPVDDLGIRKGVQLAYGLRDLPDAKRVLAIGESWRPYRSAGAWYLWRHTNVATIQQVIP